jgi:Tol biopolymer transport system component
MKRLPSVAFCLLAAFALAACGPSWEGPPYLSLKEARHLKKMTQLTFGGSNAEAYFSWDGKKIVFQSTRDGYGCDQLFTMNTDGSGPQRVSTGKGRVSCSFFLPGDKQLIYASTHHAGPDCPPPPDRSQGYVWALYDYELYRANADGSGLVRITRSPGYDAELEGVHPDGRRIVFTSYREGDLDIYTMDAYGGELRRLTHEKGYDGGPFFSWDGTKIVYRAFHPKTEEEAADYERLLKQGLIRPVRAEIIIMDADGSNKRQITDNGAANWAPAWHPNGRQIIFSSNLQEPGTRNFDLYLINTDGTGLERLTHGGFNSFPNFSSDGSKVLFASDRLAKGRHEFNIFIADWEP